MTQPLMQNLVTNKPPLEKISPRRLARSIGWTFLVLAIVPFGIAIWLFMQGRTLQAEGITAPGVVVEIRYETSEAGRQRRFVMTAFTDDAGREHQVHIPGRDYRVGQVVEMIFPPGNPVDAVPNNFDGLWLSAAIVATGGVFCLLIFPLMHFAGPAVVRAWMRTSGMAPYLPDSDEDDPERIEQPKKDRESVTKR